MTSRFRHRVVKVFSTVVILLLYGSTIGLAGASDQIDTVGASSSDQEQIAPLRDLSREAMKTYNLKSLIVRVTIAGRISTPRRWGNR